MSKHFIMRNIDGDLVIADETTTLILFGEHLKSLDGLNMIEFSVTPIEKIE